MKMFIEMKTDYCSSYSACLFQKHTMNASISNNPHHIMIYARKTEMHISGFGDAQLCAWRCSSPEPEMSISKNASADILKANTNTLNIKHKLLTFKHY